MSRWDIAAAGVIILFGLLGLSGWLNRIRGLVFGIIIGIAVVGVTPYMLERFNIDLHFTRENSVLLQYIESIFSKSQIHLERLVSENK
ncbi:MAG: hypothetical protein E3K37_03625 [Candidatus Kuenenia sp.]|nr:hypothetical protein [Candidatus Kuenenia hertensis]